MLLKQFVERTISDIREGIKEYNDSECGNQAVMPTEIEFELSVLMIGLSPNQILKVADHFDKTESIHLIKFKVSTLDYPGGKDLYK